MLNSLTPNLMVNDVEETVEYYTDVLGFTLLMTVPETGKLDDGELIILIKYLKTLKEETNVRKIEKRGWQNNYK